MKPNTPEKIPLTYFEQFNIAVREQMGEYSQHILLRQANLDQYIDWSSSLRIPPPTIEEYANFQKAIRDYYGRGSRGLLIRMGQQMCRLSIQYASPGMHLLLVGTRLLPVEPRRIHILRRMARLLGKSEKDVSVHSMDNDLIYSDRRSFAVEGQSSQEPICWVTHGLIHEMIGWACGSDVDVEEITCRAAGADACNFRLRFAEG